MEIIIYLADYLGRGEFKMGLQYKPVNRQADQEIQPQQQLQRVEVFDILEKRNELTAQLVDSKEVDDIVSTICVNDPNTIVTFGSEVAEEISKCSDQILNSVNMNQINDSGELLTQLGKIMDKFDLQEVATPEEKKGLFGKLFGTVQKQLDQLLAKYHTMGDEVDKIYVKLKQYESEITQSNKKLNTMFQSNVNYYQQLVKYILAGEQGVKEIDDYLNQMRADYEQSQDSMLQLDINNLEQAKTMLEQRVMDLRMAENVAMQSVPMIKSMEYSNLNLIRKINSAFIVTLPVFKQALTQAILLKRQRIQAQAMQALDERTNEMLLKNAQNTAAQTKLTAQLASGSSVKIETLEQTWKIIVNGIEETKQIQENAKKKRQEDTVRLNQLKEDFKEKMSASIQ